MDSLVIHISMWRDDNGVRARLSSDADGRSTLHVAASVDELLRLVTEEVGRWEHGVTTS
jgi:hypothetical protein